MADAPIPLTARRGRLRAKIAYANRGGAALEAQVAPSLRAPEAVAVRRLSVRGLVPPGQTGDLAVKLQIDPRTPPGRYAAALRLGDREIPVELLVPEERRVHLLPSLIATHVAPGQELAHPIVVENDGNVPVSLHDPDAVALQPVEALHDLVRRALQQLDSDDPEAFQRSLVARGRESIQADRGRLVLARLDDGPRELAPGGRALVTLRFRAPQKLDRGVLYQMQFQLAGVAVQFRLHYPRNGGGGDSP